MMRSKFRSIPERGLDVTSRMSSAGRVGSAGVIWWSRPGIREGVRGGTDSAAGVTDKGSFPNMLRRSGVSVWGYARATSGGGMKTESVPMNAGSGLGFTVSMVVSLPGAMTFRIVDICSLHWRPSRFTPDLCVSRKLPGGGVPRIPTDNAEESGVHGACRLVVKEQLRTRIGAHLLLEDRVYDGPRTGKQIHRML